VPDVAQADNSAQRTTATNAPIFISMAHTFRCQDAINWSSDDYQFFMTRPPFPIARFKSSS
jgi:hypothetical protein